MLTEIERDQIKKRLSAIPDLGHRGANHREILKNQFDEICGVADSTERAKSEKAFLNRLAELESYVSYLRGRGKI